MNLKMDLVGSRQDIIQGLQIKLDELEEEETKEYEEEKKKRRNKIPFTDEQLNEVADRLSSKEVSIFFDEEIEDEEVEDDGFIHVRRHGVRFVKEGYESQLPSFAKNVEKKMEKLIKLKEVKK
jgi:hypothetical protein